MSAWPAAAGTEGICAEFLYLALMDSTDKTALENLLSVVLGAERLYALLKAFDQGAIPFRRGRLPGGEPLTPEETWEILRQLRAQDGLATFGVPREKGLVESLLLAPFQSAGGQDIYPSVVEKAAALLYLFVKRHPFEDGNKRTGSALFLAFLAKNGLLKKGTSAYKNLQQILAWAVLYVANSPDDDKDRVIRLLAHMVKEVTRPLRQKRST